MNQILQPWIKFKDYLQIYGLARPDSRMIKTDIAQLCRDIIAKLCLLR